MHGISLRDTDDTVLGAYGFTNSGATWRLVFERMLGLAEEHTALRNGLRFQGDRYRRFEDSTVIPTCECSDNGNNAFLPGECGLA